MLPLTVPTASISIYAKLDRLDPTRTTTLRNAFVADMNRRFTKFVRIIREKIVDEDCFGLFLSKFEALESFHSYRDFAFASNQDKVDGFMGWLKEQEKTIITHPELGDTKLITTKKYTQIGSAIEKQWTDTYITDAYSRGVQRAQYEMGKAGYPLPEYLKGDIFGVGLINVPIHADRVGVLYSRAFEELKGITATMDTQISRVLAQGLMDGKNPVQLARMLNTTITGAGDTLAIKDSLGRFIPAQRRAQTLARTEIIRAHHMGNIQEMRNWGVAGVTVKAEWVTGSNPCPECDLMAAGGKKEYTLDQIEGLIPLHPNCFLDSQVPVYTSKGWRAIGDIAVGDQVLTHKGRFRRVYALPHSRGVKGSTHAVRFSISGMPQGGLSMTADHPVLASGSAQSRPIWKSAKDVKVSDCVWLLANRCKRCGTLIPYFREYCSQSCLSKGITERQWADPSHRENISKKASAQMKREYDSGARDRSTITRMANEKTRELARTGDHIFQQSQTRQLIRKVTNTPAMCRASSMRMKQSNPMHDPVARRKATISFNRYLDEHPEVRLNKRMAKHRKSGKKTGIEQRMAVLLDKLGIDYVFQYPILRYNVDFAIPSLRIAIECDGEYWHKNKDKDALRQHRIEEQGWFVLRYTESRINQCLSDIESELCRVVLNHMGAYEFIRLPIKKIDTWRLKKNRPLYNLSVEQDESYIAKGMVVHNCRCCAVPIVQNGKGIKSEPSAERSA